MGTNKRIPTTDAEFNNYINLTIPYINTNKARLATTPTAVAALTSATALLTTAGTGWNAIYPLTQNPATATVSIRSSKNILHDQISAQLRIIFDDIPRSLLTQVDRDTLNIPLPNNTRTAAAVPSEKPSITIALREHLSITLNVVDSSHPQSLAKPADADAIEIESVFVAVTAATSGSVPQEADYRHLTTSGRCTVVRTYSQDQLRGTEYLRARYLNSRKEPGGWSEVISVVVS